MISFVVFGDIYHVPEPYLERLCGVRPALAQKLPGECFVLSVIDEIDVSKLQERVHLIENLDDLAHVAPLEDIAKGVAGQRGGRWRG